MHEIELKCQVPAARREPVRRAVATATASTVRLQARYFDTPDRRLAAAGIALRLRREGTRWVQTLKGRGDGLMVRLEHECVVADGADAPALDLARHAGTPAGELLQRVLAAEGTRPLGETFATDIHRTQRRVRHAGALIELAFDEGCIRAGDAELAVCEIEFELIDGPAAALPELVRRWADRHGIWIDPRSKAERGERLARGLVQVPAVKAAADSLRPDDTAASGWCRVVAGALTQALANAAELAEGLGTPDHLHQCRVGLRRLRSALRDLHPLVRDLPALAACRALDEALGGLARQLGVQRDADVLLTQWLPRWQQAGCPAGFALPAAAAVDVPALLREPATTAHWLALIGAMQAAQQPDAAATPAGGDWPARLRRRWHRLYRQAVGEGAGYAGLSDDERHHVRKRMKRLRYAVEAGARLVSPKPLDRFLAAVRQAQEALGDDHDLVAIQTQLDAVPPAQRSPAQWFVAGWLAGARPESLRRCQRALDRLAEAPAIWRARHLIEG